MTAPADVGAAQREFMAVAERLPALFKMVPEFLEVVALIETAEEEEDVAAWEARLDELAGGIARKAENIVGLSRWYDTLAGARRAEVAGIEAGARLYEGRAQRLREYLVRQLKDLGEPIHTSRYSISVRQNNPSVEVLDAALIPDEFNRKKIVVEPDKVAILAHRKATGEIVAGVNIVRTERLDVK